MKGLRSSLVSFVATDADHNHKVMGTGFIVAGNDQMAVVVTAKHVVADAIFHQRKYTRIPTSPLLEMPRPLIEPKDMKAFWTDGVSPNLMPIHWVSYNATLDMAVCVITPPEKHANPFAPMSIPFDTRAVQVGDQVNAVACLSEEAKELAPPADSTGRGQILQLESQAFFRTGFVTAVYPGGFRHYRWPCFTASFPVEPGMSGGFVFVERKNETVAAVGVLSAGPKASDLNNDTATLGEAVVLDAWTGLGLLVPDRLPSVDAPTSRIRDVLLRGAMPMAIGGVDHIVVHEQADSDDYAVEWLAAKAPVRR